MARSQLALAISLCTIVSLGIPSMNGLHAADGVVPATTDLAADASENVETGYAEACACEPDACGPDSCEPDCCPTSLTGCCPAWTVEAGVIFLSRDNAKAQPSPKIMSPSQNGAVYDSAQSGLGTAVGPDLSLARCISPCFDIQARYFQIDGWNDTNTFGDLGRGYLMGYNTTVLTQDPTVSYSSRLYNVELNLRWKQWKRMPFIMGFRTLGLDETFQVASLDTPVVRTSTNNGLYGMQIGVEPVLWDQCGRFRVEGLVKAGIFGNSTRQRTVFYQADQEFAHNSDGVPSCVAELGLVGVYSLNKCWSLRAGYEVMWLTSVALAPDQTSSVTYGVPVTGVTYDKATAFYYGATARLERRF